MRHLFDQDPRGAVDGSTLKDGSYTLKGKPKRKRSSKR